MCNENIVEISSVNRLINKTDREWKLICRAQLSVGKRAHESEEARLEAENQRRVTHMLWIPTVSDSSRKRRIPGPTADLLNQHLRLIEIPPSDLSVCVFKLEMHKSTGIQATKYIYLQVIFYSSIV